MIVAAKPRVRVKAQTKYVTASVVEWKRRPDPCIQSMLSQFTEIASNGSIDGMAIAATAPNGNVHTAYVIGENIFTLIGTLEHLQRRVRQNLS